MALPAGHRGTTVVKRALWRWNAKVAGEADDGTGQALQFQPANHDFISAI